MVHSASIEECRNFRGYRLVVEITEKRSGARSRRTITDYEKSPHHVKLKVRRFMKERGYRVHAFLVVVCTEKRALAA